MRRATAASDALARDPDTDRERYAHAPEHEVERRRHGSPELKELEGGVEIVDAEHQGEGREKREQDQREATHQESRFMVRVTYGGPKPMAIVT
jgi:hypothetical protein